jgi:hypothetical protein
MRRFPQRSHTAMTRYHFECPECEFDDTEAGALATETQIFCTLCFEDTGHIVRLRRWPATNCPMKSEG